MNLEQRNIQTYKIDGQKAQENKKLRFPSKKEVRLQKSMEINQNIIFDKKFFLRY
jgi:hypothetical protein